MSSRTKVVLVGVGGASCSGKSTLTEWLSKLLPGIIIHQDKFYKPSSEIPVVNGSQNWDSPESLDMPAFSRTLTSLSLDIPTNLIGKNRPTISDSDVPASHILLLTSKIRTMHESAKGKGIKLKFVLVDGFLLYVDREVVNKLDVRFLMKASFETLRRRREDRSGYVTDAGFWKDPPNYFAEIVYPAYLTFNRSALDTLEKAETHDRIEGLIGLDSEELDIASMVEAAVDRIVEHVENTVVDGGSEITA